MESLDRMKMLMEYKFKEQGNDMSTENKPHSYSFPTFSEYTKEYTKEADGDEDEPVELDDDGLPKKVAPETPVDGEEMGDGEQEVDMGEPSDSTDAVKSAFAGDDMNSNIEYGEEQPEVAGGYDFDEMEAKLDYQNDKIEAILKNIEKINSFLPKPETPEDKIIKKLDSLEAEIKNIKNADSIKRELVATKNPYNIPLKDYFSDEKDEKEEEFVITPSDIENYNPDDIKRSLGL